MSDISTKFNSVIGLLGAPLGQQQRCADGTGEYRHFERGSIHWHPATGAFETHGAIRSKWAELGWERGFLGYPVSDEGEISEWNLDGLTNTGNAAARDSGILVAQPTKELVLIEPVLFSQHQLGIDSSFARISYFQHGAIAFVRENSRVIVYKRRESRQRYQTAFIIDEPKRQSLIKKIGLIIKDKP